MIGGLFETVAAAVVDRRPRQAVEPIALPDEFLDAGALPTLHDRYGLSDQRIVAKVLADSAEAGPAPRRGSAGRHSARAPAVHYCRHGRLSTVDH